MTDQSDDWDREFAGLIERADAEDWERVARGIERDLPPRPLIERAGSRKRATLGEAIPIAGPKPLPRIQFRDIRPQLFGLWRVKGLLATSGLATVYAYSGAAKTFFMVDLGGHIALGWDWRGRKVKQGLVVYVAAEGQTGLLNRLAAWKIHHGLAVDADAPFVLVPCPINMLDPAADMQRLIALIREEAADHDETPAMIVMDTLSKTFGGGSEVTDDMARYVDNCQRVASEFGTLVVVVHHRPLNAESEEPRGHGSLKAGMDTVILLEAGKPRRWRVTKQKDGELGEPGAFDLKSIYLGDDEDGEAVTSCVVEHIEGPAPIVAKSGRKLSDKQTLAVDALRRAIAEDGRDAPPGIPADMMKFGLIDQVTTLAAWRDRALAASASPDSKPDTLAKGFARHVESLQTLGIVQVWEGFAWLPA